MLTIMLCLNITKLIRIRIQVIIYVFVLAYAQITLFIVKQPFYIKQHSS